MFAISRVQNNAKILVIILITAIMVAFTLMFSVQAFLAETPKETEPEYFEFNSDTGTFTDYDPSGGLEIVIPSKIAGVNVSKIGVGAFYKNDLTLVRIPEGVMEIAKQAFQGNNLSSIEIPNSVKVIGAWAFGKNNLTTLVIRRGEEVNRKGPESPGLKEIGKQAFYENNLVNLEIPESVEIIGDWAFGNNELTSVLIPDSIRKMGKGVFYNNNLTSVKVPSMEVIKEELFVKNDMITAEISVDVK